MYLNKIILAALAYCLMFPSFAQEDKVSKDRQPDSLVMTFGESSRIMFLINGEKDLYQILKFDLNAMVEDISIGVDTTDGKTYLSIVDPTGQKYLMRNAMPQNNLSIKSFPPRDWDKIIEDIKADDRLDYKFRAEFGESSSASKEVVKERKKNFRLRQSGIHSFTNVELGLTNFLVDQQLPDTYDNPYSLRPWGSYTFGVNFIGKTNVVGPLFLEWGPGISYNQFRLEEAGNRIVVDRDLGRIDLINDPALEGIRSQFNATYINFSVMPSMDLGWFRFNRKHKFYSDWRSYSSGALRFGLGGYAGYRIGSRSRFEYRIGGEEFKDITRSDHFLNNWRYGMRAQVGWRGIDLFATYDLNPLFASGRGPDAAGRDLNMITFGIIF